MYAQVPISLNDVRLALTIAHRYSILTNSPALYLTIAHLLWGFDFKPSPSGLTPDATLETGYTGGFNMRPHPFECKIEVRSEKHRETILREAGEAKEGLREFEEFDD